jgi:hypothetical protein
MNSTITLLGDEVVIDVSRDDFYDTMLAAIVESVFRLLGPEFDKQAYLDEVGRARSAVEIGQERAIPVSIALSLNVGYCLGQLKSMGVHFNCDSVLEDVYKLWRTRLREMLRNEMFGGARLH